MPCRAVPCRGDWIELLESGTTMPDRMPRRHCLRPQGGDSTPCARARATPRWGLPVRRGSGNAAHVASFSPLRSKEIWRPGRRKEGCEKRGKQADDWGSRIYRNRRPRSQTRREGALSWIMHRRRECGCRLDRQWSISFFCQSRPSCTKSHEDRSVSNTGFSEWHEGHQSMAIGTATIGRRS